MSDGVKTCELSHHPTGRDATHDGPSVIAIRRDNRVLRLESCLHSDADGLLANVQVQKPTNLFRLIESVSPLLQSSNMKHLPVVVNSILLGNLCSRRWASIEFMQFCFLKKGN